MNKQEKKYEYEVSFGLLAIMFILLLLNVASNYTIHQARMSERETAQNNFNTAALTATRMVQQSSILFLTESQKEKLLKRYNLSQVIYLQSVPDERTSDNRRRWQEALKCSEAEGITSVMAENLFESEFGELTRDQGDSYFYMALVPRKTGQGLLIFSSKAPLLAYLDDTGRIVLIASAVLALALFGVYFLLFRFILSPFRRLRKEAVKAGRAIAGEQDDVEAMVTDYRCIIAELRDKESKLIRLNREIQYKADSLEQFNRHILRSIDSGIITIEPDGKVLYINMAAADIMSIEIDHYAGRHYWDIFNSSVVLIDAVSRALECGKNLPYREVDFTRNDGIKLKLGATVSTISDNLRTPLGVSVLINDLTELALLHSDLEAKRRLADLGEMAGGLAHQLRNSLGAIAGYANLIRKKMKKGGLEIDNLSVLVQETEEAGSLIERFLYFAKAFDIYPERIHIDNLIAELLDAFRVRSDCLQMEFIYNGNNGIVVNCDALLVKQALTNVIENAVNAYQGESGTVMIQVEQRTTDVVVKVEDFGCGIQHGELEKIFTPFFSSRPSGTGLGLPLARKIVDLHKGRLTVSSEPDKGTRFEISLPLESPHSDGFPDTNREEVLAKP